MQKGKPYLKEFIFLYGIAWFLFIMCPYIAGINFDIIVRDVLVDYAAHDSNRTLPTFAEGGSARQFEGDNNFLVPCGAALPGAPSRVCPDFHVFIISVFEL